MVLWRRLLSTALAAAALAACSKAPENAAAAMPAPAVVTSSAPATPAAAAQPASSVAPSGDHPAAATPAAAAPETAAPPPTPAQADTAAAKPKAAAHAKPASAGAAAHVAAPATPADGPKKFDCGEKGQPACPLQGFMKSQMATAAASGDGAVLAKALDEVAGHAPPGLANWSTIAKGGAAKARAGDFDGAKASCKACHDQYKSRYKTEMRDRAW